MPETRVEQLERRLRELESDVAAELRDFSAAAIDTIARQAVASGEVSDEDLLEVLEGRLRDALLGAVTIMVLDATQRIGIGPGPDAVRPAVDAAMREAAKHLLPSARKAIAETVSTAFRRGWSVERTARQLQKFLTLAPSQVGRMDAMAKALRRDPVAAAAKYEVNLPANPTQSDLNRVVDRFRARLVRERSLVIARQELWRAGQAAEHSAWEAAVENGDVARGSVTKHWRDQDDAHVRSAHRPLAELYPQGIGLDEGFVTSRGVLRYPLDPRGSADNVIGCRCWLVYMVGGEVR